MRTVFSLEVRQRVPEANLAALEIREARSIFEALDGGSPVNSVTFNVKTGEVLIGVAMSTSGVARPLFASHEH